VYVNGIALGVLELKRSTISVGEGIRQNLGNKNKNIIGPFFSTVQLVMAGNDTEGFPVHPGDRIGANVTYNGRRSDGTLEFDAYVTDWDARQRGQQSDAHIQMFTDPGVSVSDAAGQGGCLVERDDDGTNDFGQPFGGLAKFGAPIRFQQFPNIGATAPGCGIADATTPGTNPVGIARFDGFGTVTRWDMTRNGPKDTTPLAKTGSRQSNGEFSVTWKDWR
jgi:hypothetical protein